ncbi:stage III sporulation protein SpoAB [Fictibacillus macauensis ZFHKF-1]|uniref:Stage III sporulation protein SpoAB n=1 Tax=Fictibacillus macauensis ZFHKF-1 TaxID=1196324 RepID=I8J694_9BACL|nr:stage III sporulation protein SpoIIIAB [Fictibacillus macauensis]EIT87336.1 stage III sporulation protein SpoAB [Fictibacillus macauensis ZFHKF-1]
MISFLGASLILFSTSWMGFAMAKKVKERPKQLRELKVALQSLEAEIMYGHVPLDEAFGHLSRQLNEPIAAFFGELAGALQETASSVPILWEEALTRLAERSSLKKAELEVLQQFGSTLGRHDRDNQKRHIQLTLSHLERELDEATAAVATYEKLYKSVGVLSGLLLIILLI